MNVSAEECVILFLKEAYRLGVVVMWSNAEPSELDASYHAAPGAPGRVVLRGEPSARSSGDICTLLSHEMVHVLQHWRGNLKATPPLGWPTDGAPLGRQLSIQEAEAHTSQQDPAKVLEAVRGLPNLTNQP